MPYTPRHQDIAVTLRNYVKAAKKSAAEAASEAYRAVIDELAHRRWLEQFDSSPDSLPREVRNFLYVLYADNEINNGGFVQYFSNGYGQYAEAAVNAFKEIGAPRKAAQFATVMASFPGGRYPKTVDEYSELHEERGDEFEFLIDGDLEHVYYESGESIEELMVLYVQQHYPQFAP